MEITALPARAAQTGPGASLPTSAAPPTSTVHVIADSDSRWKWGAALAGRLAAGLAGASVEGHLLPGRATPTDAQLANVGGRGDPGGASGVSRIRRMGIAELLAELRRAAADGTAGVVVLACVGGTTQALMHGLAWAWEGLERRPVVVTGYVGIVYERVVDGVLLRAGADLVLANSAHDARRFDEVFRAVGADPSTLVQTALPFLGGAPWDATAAGRQRPFTVCFAAQPSVPALRDERRHLLEQAILHAQLHPERRVLFKLRGRPGEQTTHVEPFHYETLLPDAPLPANFDFLRGDMTSALDQTDLLVTVSSTAALEAMHRNIPTAILCDVGLRESLGNHYFLQSGALTSWRVLHEGTVPQFDRAWAADRGALPVAVGDDDEHDPYRAARDRVAALVATRESLAPLHPWFDVDNAPAYLPRLLARNGLDVDGAPLIRDPAWTLADPGLARRAVRAVARRLYRLGSQRVEPHLRTWARL